MARPDDLEPVDAADDDDEALHWAGDDERGREAPLLRHDDPVAPEGSAPEPAAPGSRGRAAATASFVVFYLLWTVGWVFVAQRLTSGATTLPSELLWQFGEFLAMLAAPLWFVATLSLTREHRPLVRVGWLALGLGLLVPWPFVLDLLAALQIAGSLS